MKTKLSLYFATVMLLTILAQAACKKEPDADPVTVTDEELSYISQEDFMSKLQGKWSCTSFCVFLGEYPMLNFIQISFTQDSCRYATTGNYSQMYPLNDPILCTLPHVENIQKKWTITNSNDDLMLKTIYWCSGDTVTYKISFSNYRYGLTKDWLTGKTFRSNQISADIQLINSETIILNQFWLNDDLKEFGFSISKIDEGGPYGEAYRFISL